MSTTTLRRLLSRATTNVHRWFFIHWIAVRHILGDIPTALQYPRLRWWGGLYWGEIKWSYKTGRYKL